MLVQRLFDLSRVDVVPATNYQVLLAVDDVVVPVGVDDGDIARGEPAILDRLVGGVGQIPITLHHIRALDLNLPRRSPRHRAPVLIDEAYLYTLDRGADRSRAAFGVRVIERHGGRRFGEAVALQDYRVESLLEIAEYRDGQGRAAGDARAQCRRRLLRELIGNRQ